MGHKIAFLLNSKDIHSVDWYKCAVQALGKDNLYFVTDIPDYELLESLEIPNNNLVLLCPLNKLLFLKGTTLGNLWRNFLKLVVLPLQIIRLRKFKKSHPDMVFYAIAMYYMFLARMARVPYGGTPIGSELLVRPQRSKLYRLFAKYALKGASFVTVDSFAMAEKAFSIASVKTEIVQNGINLQEIKELTCRHLDKKEERVNTFLSIRSIDYLYRILGIIIERNKSTEYRETPIQFIYPFFDTNYVEDCKKESISSDNYLGRLDRQTMYEVLMNTKIAFSIPQSDSSPRSVYEAIFLGCIVIACYNKYFDLLPQCMQERIVLVDIRDEDWFDKSVHKALEISHKSFVPTSDAYDMFDQNKSFMKIYHLLENIEIK